VVFVVVSFFLFPHFDLHPQALRGNQNLLGEF
jgi:hypothetical protein